ncbi:hypothetical protein E2C01_006811 [Portunus trituberculatus]|uniref:Uncharacterized protein n=1 Tax=Portunus trituberculatus TaxID=210409 RepID=A0A5B7CXS4_PORTR|nr:hypothetical protein [Portunus trituberculatus]
MHLQAATRNTTPLHLAPPPLRDKTPPPTLTRDIAIPNSLNTSKMTNSPTCPWNVPPLGMVVTRPHKASQDFTRLYLTPLSYKTTVLGSTGFISPTTLHSSYV